MSGKCCSAPLLYPLFHLLFYSCQQWSSLKPTYRAHSLWCHFPKQILCLVWCFVGKQKSPRTGGGWWPVPVNQALNTHELHRTFSRSFLLCLPALSFVFEWCWRILGYRWLTQPLKTRYSDTTLPYQTGVQRNRCWHVWQGLLVTARINTQGWSMEKKYATSFTMFLKHVLQHQFSLYGPAWYTNIQDSTNAGRVSVWRGVSSCSFAVKFRGGGPTHNHTQTQTLGHQLSHLCFLLRRESPGCNLSAASWLSLRLTK